jgi:hypothetical protein
VNDVVECLAFVHLCLGVIHLSLLPNLSVSIHNAVVDDQRELIINDIKGRKDFI